MQGESLAGRVDGESEKEMVVVVVVVEEETVDCSQTQKKVKKEKTSRK